MSDTPTVTGAYTLTALTAERDQLRARAEKAEAELAKYLSACPASPTEEERKRCQHWWSISGRSPPPKVSP